MPQPLSELQQELAAGYVLGDLDIEEVNQAEQLLENDPNFQQEVRALQISLEFLPQALPRIAPPPGLQQKILAAYQGTTETAPEGTPQSTVPIAPGFPRQQPEARQIAWSRILVGIAALAALLLGIDNLQLRQQLSSVREGNLEKVAEILQQPKSRLISLAGTNNSPATGTLLFTAGQWQEVIVSLGNLPPLPADQIYRMWLTLENGQVIFCGEFNTDDQGRVFVELNPAEVPPKGVKAQGLFVTVSPESAPLEPKGEKVVVGEI
ncbi:MAG: hypothetical protein HC825_01180 [Oscillatoriales cyanobacterium RM1_1_9]|nr:hypothetical protein [Oscillatoriales cyanobacterium SM2_3_0]NJO46101.1 hypothetical protein [Oscillatoriales cyanobacterium RM2_1_1]NJO70694.1 hypothetical protein [Oscillatoriales cyanobacterium RM1_1_9]